MTTTKDNIARTTEQWQAKTALLTAREDLRSAERMLETMEQGGSKEWLLSSRRKVEGLRITLQQVLDKCHPADRAE